MQHFIHVSVKKYEVLGLAALARHRAGEEPGATQHMPQRSHAMHRVSLLLRTTDYNVLLSAAH